MPILEFEKVTKKYYRRRGFFRTTSITAVEGVDLAVNSGELLLITGPSGAGKSTIAQLMVGLIQPTAGRIVFNGTEVSGRNMLRSLAGRRQIVFQNPYRALSPRLTVADIVVEPARIIGKFVKFENLLDRVGLSYRLAGRRPRELSAGERQRVAVARALSTDPELLVLDEPTSALDPISTEGINRLIKDIHHNLAVVLISHDRRIRRFADKTAEIKAAKISDFGPFS